MLSQSASNLTVQHNTVYHGKTISEWERKKVSFSSFSASETSFPKLTQQNKALLQKKKTLYEIGDTLQHFAAISEAIITKNRDKGS